MFPSDLKIKEFKILYAIYVEYNGNIKKAIPANYIITRLNTYNLVQRILEDLIYNGIIKEMGINYIGITIVGIKEIEHSISEANQKRI